MSETAYNIGVYLLILNVVLPVFAYSFMDIRMDQSFEKEITYLNEDDLIASGIYLQVDERHELTYGNYVDFVNVSETLRVKWDDPVYWPNFQFYTSLFGLDYILKVYLKVDINGILYWYDQLSPNLITNQTIITNFNEKYNWTRASIRMEGLEVFFTAEAFDNNITEAILGEGRVNVTIGKPIDYQDVEAEDFIGWYWGLLSGNNTYNLPVSLSWLFRLQALLLVFSAVVIARDLLPIP